MFKTDVYTNLRRLLIIFCSTDVSQFSTLPRAFRFFPRETFSPSLEIMANMSMLLGSSPKSSLRIPSTNMHEHKIIFIDCYKCYKYVIFLRHQIDILKHIYNDNYLPKHFDICGWTACTFLVCARISKSSSFDRK